MIVLGIDPGLTGGLAIVTGDRDVRARLVEAIDVPCEGEGPKREVSPSVLDFISKHKPDAAYIERAQAMPDQGSSSGFIYGKAYGALRMAVRGMRIPLTTIESTAWKKAHSLIKTGKEDSRLRALSLLPEGADFLARKKDHGRAEAALIAWYGLLLLKSGA